jgi:hypothetical protein
MKAFIGLLLVISGAALGLYVGLYLCFICGIIELIQAIRAPELIASTVAWSIVKIMFAGLAGWISAILLVVPGVAMLADS